MSEKDPSVSDEEWAAFVEAARKDGVGVGPAPKARRRRFARREAASQGQPEGWRTGPAWQEMKGRSKVRRQVKGVVGITLAAGLLLLALRPDLITDRLPVGLGGSEDTPLAAETARPTEAPAREMLPDRPTPEEPFKGSPALRWADGAAGIQVPQAAAVGWMSKDQVAAALKRTKEFLVAANLDPAVIQGGKPEAALRLLDPQQSDLRPRLEKALATPTAENDPTHVFSRFDPAEVRLVGSVVKTRGRMTVEKGTGKNAGTVLIHTDSRSCTPS
ncbi:hypothetical protein ABZX98_02425 [Streptomyces sp. NPDC002992]|uniref:hypothetical protein n=1 Tax=Streptomyces sp. NPDC002992 TaxID=3154273 RepID=UPI0033B9304A